MTIAKALEHLLTQQQSPAEAGSAWWTLDTQLAKEGKRERRKRRLVIVGTIVVAISVILVTAFIATATRH
jgi:accessory gene regulator protein AgrB